MNITDGGIISQFLDLLGVQITTATDISGPARVYNT